MYYRSHCRINFRILCSTKCSIVAGTDMHHADIHFSNYYYNTIIRQIMCIMWLYILSVALKHLAMATVNFELRTHSRGHTFMIAHCSTSSLRHWASASTLSAKAIRQKKGREIHALRIFFFQHFICMHSA